MPEKVIYNKGDKYIFVKSVGDVSVSEWENSLRLVRNIKQCNGINKVLVDTTEQFKTSTLDFFLEFVEKLPKDIYFALLVEKAGHCPKTTEPTQRFLEGIAIQQGAMVRSFIEINNAIHWLNNPDE